ncbi:hypothetical protein [Bacillus sp. MHSD17]|uniref:hypothetical protein n=1 Tax=Bacillus sp. MHSD17 TaxID=3026937 RepID=UPI003FD0FBE0
MIYANVKAIQKMMNSKHVEIAHTYKEGNKLAKYLTNYAFTCIGTYINKFQSVQDTPQTAKAIVQLKIIKYPNLRIRKFKIGNITM